MKNWPALIVAPSLALANLSVTYALVTPSCARQSTLAPQLVTAALLLACVWMSWGAWGNWKRGGVGGATHGMPGGDAAPQRGPFIALVASLVGALSALVVLAQWFPQWVLSPCAN
jgi:hypothetical protein